MTHSDSKHTNQLIHQSSPYLLQHAHNPVNWYPWGEEALQKAQKENKLLLISIGYSACHWCHVMEHESFEDEQVAAFMNAHYVAIKIDREERPDIDQVYMNAVQLLSGSGGWPLNCIALPDGRPIYGGTYFPKEQWLDMLEQVNLFVEQNPEKTQHQARLLTEGVQASEMALEQDENSEFIKYTATDLQTIVMNWKPRIDFVLGGTLGAPKFPLPVGYQFLLQHHHLTTDPEALKAVTTTLDHMANGGIYDQIGGGFARYSVDDQWKAPHFEKMLYDNAQLVSLYSAAYQQTKDPKYKQIVSETLLFIAREMSSAQGGFYSALDADSEGVEGRFYVWKQATIKEILGIKADIIMDYYGVTKNGNWENGENILLASHEPKQIAEKHALSEEELQQEIRNAKEILLRERAKRIRPGLDDKILTSWNSLMIKGYVDAYRAFGNPQYLQAARTNAEFILEKVASPEGRLNRNYKDNNSTINGFLDDYAFTIQAFIALYQATFEEKWLYRALDMTRYTLTHFYDEKLSMFYYTSNLDAPLIARKMELTDNVIPAANSEMAKNLFVLGHYFYDDAYVELSKRMLNNVKDQTIQGATYYANWDILMAWFVNEPAVVAIVGDNAQAIRKAFDNHYLPNTFLSGGKEEGALELLSGKLIKGQTTIYLCRHRVCQHPTTDVETAIKSLSLK